VTSPSASHSGHQTRLPSVVLGSTSRFAGHHGPEIYPGYATAWNSQECVPTVKPLARSVAERAAELKVRQNPGNHKWPSLDWDSSHADHFSLKEKLNFGFLRSFVFWERVTVDEESDTSPDWLA